MADRAPADRLHRELLAQVRQQFGAPADAILGHAELLLGAAERQGLGALFGDMKRLQDAASKLKTLVAGAPELAAAHPDFAEFRRVLRHDLRTAIGLIQGLGEMLLEGRHSAGETPGLEKMLETAAGLLARVDALVESAPAAHAGEGPRPRPAAPASEPPSRILIVDDTDETRALLSRRLEREGHEVVEASDGRAALGKVADAPFDLILLDIVMPAPDGYEVLKQLKANPRRRHIPVIVISALDELDSVVRCIEAGAEDYLTKPFNPVLLDARIGASLEKMRLRAREKALQEAMESALLAHDKRLEDAVAASKSEIEQLRETIVALRQQLDAAVAAARTSGDEARSSAAAEIHQLRATCASLRDILEGQRGAPIVRQVNDGR